MLKNKTLTSQYINFNDKIQILTIIIMFGYIIFDKVRIRKIQWSG